MSQDESEFERKLAELKNRYLGELPGKLRDVQSEADKLKVNLNEEQHRVLKRSIHTLVGSSGVFGLTDLSDALREIETSLPEIIEISSDYIDDIKIKIDRLIVSLDENIPLSDEKNLSNAISQESNTDEHEFKKDIVLAGFDEADGENLSKQFEYFSYDVKLTPDVNELSFDDQYNHSVVLILRCTEDTLESIADKITSFREKSLFRIPLIICSESNSFSIRYEAATIGCEHFLSGAIDISRLVDSIEECFSSVLNDIGRVISIDDDKDLTDYLSVLFSKHGFNFKACSAPEEMIDVISEFNPDLVLMDLNMPEYQGEYLASVIRQFSQWSSMPVLYLSSETNAKKIHFAMSRGADDYLLKPFNDDELVFKVKYKIQRYRLLNKLVSLDGLTGLLKHSVIKQTLDTELERAFRLNYNISVAMIDVDFFKSINDLYGHATGDQVLSSLSQVLKNRFRRCDFVGRYGGEEFLVILPNCALKNATEIIDRIRMDFSSIEFSSDNKLFKVTFSAGVTCFQGDDVSSGTLINLADKLLYKAKESGRNRVISE